MHTKKFICIVLLAALCFGSVTSFAYAKTVNELKNEKNGLAKKNEDLKKKLDQVSKEKNSLTNEVDKLDIELQIAENTIAETDEKLSEVQASLTKTEQELIEAEDKKDKQYEAMKMRIRWMYENGNIGYLDVLLGAKSFSDFLNIYEYINIIIEYDKNMFDRFAETENEIALKKQTIENSKAEYTLLLAKQEEDKEKVEQSIAQKSSLLASLEQDEDKYEQQIKEAKQQNDDIERLIVKAQEDAAKKAKAQQSFAKAPTQNTYSSGDFTWPTPGYYPTSSSYVNRINPISGKSEFHTGLDIPAPKGTNVKASKAGTVIYSDWMSGYGYTIMIDHGNGVSTLYAHNSSLVASVGTEVNQGDTVAKVGSTGYSTGNHCHFEVRVNGKHQNPSNYLK